MPASRYPQFCALARAAEVLGERWTLLIVRELLLGPKRFSDLRARLDGPSPTVLTERLGRAERVGLVRRVVLPPPAASTVYELTEDGEALRPAVYELIRWGGRRMEPARKGDRAEPDWMRLALAACARRGPTPRRTFRLRVTGRDAAEVTLRVTGGRQGTSVAVDDAPAETTIVADVPAILGLVSGDLPAGVAIKKGAIMVSGDRAAVRDFPRLFEVQRSRQHPPKEGRS
ncbi:MAG: transcriptional regulator [Candidatus Rokubacteria bacterium]|nr:transcriptional regulator [Candidatus Rokubacteria bacterium]